MSHLLRHAPKALVLGLGVNALLLTTSLSAPLKPKPAALTSDMARVLADFPSNRPAAVTVKPSPDRRLAVKHLRKHHRKPKHKHRPKRPAIKHAAPSVRGMPATGFIAAPPPPPSFASVYGGVAAGAQWMRQNKKTNVFGALPPFHRNARFANPGAGLWGLAGFNYQNGSLIAGVEGDIGYADPEASHGVSPYGALAPIRGGLNGSFRGRLGIEIFDRVMIFGSSGLVLDTLTKASPQSSTDTIAPGWTAGAGIEGRVAPGVFLRGEYLFGQFPGQRIDTHTIRGGLSIKF